jgi:drug/metabolite transporter (DMT)-like permease
VSIAVTKNIESAVTGAPDQDVRRAVAFILTSSALFAALNAVVKLLSARLGPLEIAFFRQFFSLVPVSILLARQGGLAMLRTQRPVGHLFRGLIGNAAMIVFFLSVAWLPLADATALSFSSPLFVTALAAPLLGEAVGVVRWCAVAVGFVGVVVITNPSGGLFSHGESAGAALGVVAGFMSALMMITIRQLGRTEPPVRTVFFFATIGSVVFGLILPFFWVHPTGWEWLGLAGVGLLGGLSQLTMTQAYRHAPAATLAPFNYISIVWSTIFGYALWGDLPSMRVVTGAGIVITSGLFIVYRETRRGRLEGLRRAAS